MEYKLCLFSLNIFVVNVVLVVMISNKLTNLRFFFAAPLVEGDKETDESYYLLWRLEDGVAKGSAEIPKGMMTIKSLISLLLCVFISFDVWLCTGEAIPLEYNLVGLNAISRGMDVMRDVKVEAIRQTWWPGQWFQQNQTDTAAA
ncbi:hypothetical protein AALP_AA6G182200 [Arabis alpina]|uniref:Uncharacterized protein n=1 Tax=Arabis alpina TaxID=50452 RepID=A0A087GQ08_ARAAL|nr:hypothetical protein AALP_AA6G182200 [Arabis alpina]